MGLSGQDKGRSQCQQQHRVNFSYYCVKTLESRELIASKNWGPYAFKTFLGWCTVGRMCSQNKSEKLSCNRIMVNSVVTGLSLNHYFTQSDKVKDTSIEA